jgi:hypothetical protein
MSTKGYAPPLTVGEVKRLAAQGHDHHGGCLTSARARELDASIEAAVTAAYERGKREDKLDGLNEAYAASREIIRGESQD